MLKWPRYRSSSDRWSFGGRTTCFSPCARRPPSTASRISSGCRSSDSMSSADRNRTSSFDIPLCALPDERKCRDLDRLAPTRVLQLERRAGLGDGGVHDGDGHVALEREREHGPA